MRLEVDAGNKDEQAPNAQGDREKYATLDSLPVAHSSYEDAQQQLEYCVSEHRVWSHGTIRFEATVPDHGGIPLPHLGDVLDSPLVKALPPHLLP
mmetsp:Transcript_11810/g.26032  ORF Transcript_11810/g.26032 Transcript_11810/m.26032 type:complete len:95 (+) Transcript_11810:46-330(+)